MTQEFQERLNSNSNFVSSDLCSHKVRSTDLSTSSDVRCRYFLSNARKWWKVEILLQSLSALNSPVTVECVSRTSSTLSPVVYIADENKIQISASSFWTPFTYRRALARGLVYAFDKARAEVDYNNIDHVACTSIRGMNISGECDLWTKWTDYIVDDPLGMDMYSMKQRCIKRKVEEMISQESQKSSAEIREGIERVFDRCFRDHWPFTAEPHMDTRFRDSPFVQPQ